MNRSILILCFVFFSSVAKANPSVFLEKFETELKSTKLEEDGVHWAVLVAGSYTWPNYRHQADICHSYQVLKKHGIPDERIIVMMTDDIAGHPANPTPGKIFNHPDGPDVYQGVVKDYTGTSVLTPENFMRVLKGEEEEMKHHGSGKVLKSGPNDHVFINFVDHGAPGLIGFPHQRMYAKDLINTLKYMHSKNMYKKLVFYMESCNAGSMFEGLLTEDLNIFAETASNAKESSYSCYYDKRRRTYLGDLYSVNWMENADASNLGSETLQEQFSLVKAKTNASHVMEYGDMSFESDALSNYLSGVNGPDYVETSPLPPVPMDAVPSPDVPLAILQHQLRDADDAEKPFLLKQIEEIEELRGQVRATIKHVAGLVSSDTAQALRVLNLQHSLTQHDCYQTLVEDFHTKCFNLNKVDYALRHLYVLVNLCEEKVDQSLVTSVFSKVCF